VRVHKSSTGAYEIQQQTLKSSIPAEQLASRASLIPPPPYPDLGALEPGSIAVSCRDSCCVYVCVSLDLSSFFYILLEWRSFERFQTKRYPGCSPARTQGGCDTNKGMAATTTTTNNNNQQQQPTTTTNNNNQQQQPTTTNNNQQQQPTTTWASNLIEKLKFLGERRQLVFRYRSTRWYS
jgi:hypothetical protein